MASNKKRLYLYSGLALIVAFAVMDGDDKSKNQSALTQSSLAAFESLCLKNLVGLQADISSQILFCRCASQSMAHRWLESEDFVKARTEFQKQYADEAGNARAQRGVSGQQSILLTEEDPQLQPFLEALSYPKPYPALKKLREEFLLSAQDQWKQAQSSCLKN